MHEDLEIRTITNNLIDEMRKKVEIRSGADNLIDMICKELENKTDTDNLMYKYPRRWRLDLVLII